MATHKDGKTKVSISIAPDVVKKAHSLGINVSKACENTLIELIDAIENRNTVNNPLSLPGVSLGNKENPLMDRAGFEPAASALRTRRSYQADLPAQLGVLEK